MGASTKRKEARQRKFNPHATMSALPTSPCRDMEEVVDGKEATPTTIREQESLELEAHAAEAPIASEALQNEHDDVRQPGTDNGNGNMRKQRFIVFIGNLPYSATHSSIVQHFAKVQPVSIRHRTNKSTGKSKGFAFLEFSRYDRMKTCLKLYHHSMFDNGETPGRRLNVELTAGGGGSHSEDRKLKLRLKNQKLKEQRLRSAPQDKLLDNTKVSGQSHGLDDIHPSRKDRFAA